MIRLLRYKDLRARGFVKNRVQLKRLIDKYGFPSGRMISPNARAWNEDELEDWYASRPIESRAPVGAAKNRQERARKATATATA
jgi:predicted DNA-binding transcriptional regulator AlpA